MEGESEKGGITNCGSSEGKDDGDGVKEEGKAVVNRDVVRSTVRPSRLRKRDHRLCACPALPVRSEPVYQL